MNPCSVARFGELTGLYKRKYYQRKGTGNPFVDFFQAHFESVAVSEERFDAIGSPAMAKWGREIARTMKKAHAGAPSRSARHRRGREARGEDRRDHRSCFAPFTTEQMAHSRARTSAKRTHASPTPTARSSRGRRKRSTGADWFHNVHMPAMEKWILPEMDKKLARETKPLLAHETLVSLLEEMAERHGHAAALTRLESDGATRVTYRESARAIPRRRRAPRAPRA